MTYTTYKTTTQNALAGISEPAWKNPVLGHEYKNDPERDNHFFDSHKAYHAKDDVKAFSSRHNDRNFDSNPEHIAKDKSDKNVI